MPLDQAQRVPETTDTSDVNQQEAQEAQDAVPEREDANAYINIKVSTQNSDDFHFKMRSYTKLIKLQNAFAKRVGKDVNDIRFLYDGNRVKPDDTPASLYMENDDSIDVMVEQVGGLL